MEPHEVYWNLDVAPWDHMDSKIIPLVESVNLYARSFMSCQGHENSWKAPYISFNSRQNLSELKDKVWEYNDDSEIEWDFTREKGYTDTEYHLIYLEPRPIARQIGKKQRFTRRLSG